MFAKLKFRITLYLSIVMCLFIVALTILVNVSYSQTITNEIYEKLSAVGAYMPGNKIYSTLDLVGDYEKMLPLTTDDYKDLTCIFVNTESGGYSSETYSEIYILNFNDAAGYDENDYRKFAYEIVKSERSRGNESGLYFKSYKYSKGYLVLFDTDKSVNSRISSLVTVSIGFAVIMCVAGIWVSTIIAEFLVKPIKESVDMQQSFISDASHELKTPIAVINSNSEALEAEIGSNKWLTCIQTEAMRMSGLITDLLSATRLEKNINRELFVMCNISDIVEETVMTFDAMAFEKGIIIDSDVESGVNVLGNAEKLRQLVTILVDNAVKYTNENGHIQVNLSHKLGSMKLTVENTGSYISKEDRKKVFDRFYRTDESRTKIEGRAKSYGLGLSIAKTIAEQHNGDITVTSQENPMSTTFKFTL